MMVMYAFISGVSVGKLFAGGIVPGILLSLIYILYIVILAWLKPDYAPAMETEEPVCTKIKAKALLELALPLTLIFSILGTIFMGLASPTEAAAIGAAGSLVCAAIKKRLNLEMLKASCRQTFAICVCGIPYHSGIDFQQSLHRTWRDNNDQIPCPRT